MIKFLNVNKQFKNQKVIKNLNITFPDSGLIVIQGPSGCGKTTLLNLLSGLLDFQGDIIIDNRHIKLLNEKKMDDYRLKNYGFIFQDFKLFESEDVISNIMLPLDVISNAPKEAKQRKCLELIKMVGLKKSIHQKVNKLSGGEKQRVAIARALVNNPKIILADEPTGALDSKTSMDVMNILLKVSSKSLVIMVTHDDEIAHRYADEIIYMKDGEIIDRIYQEKKEKEKYIPVSKYYYSGKRSIVPSSFLLHHTYSSIKQKKYRTMICNGVTSLGLIGVGLATSLSSSISTNIKKSYSQIIDDNKITICQKNNQQTIYGKYAASYYQVMDIAENNSEYISGVGTTYYNDFDIFFPHANCIALADVSYYLPINNIGARQINEFRWLDIEKPDVIYPETIYELQDDEVVLSLTIDMINTICYQLQIERTVTSLSRYIQSNKLKMYFDFRNDYWQYSDQQLFTVVGFTLEKKPGIYHSNHMWNEYMFEERMRFPITDNISQEASAPWYLKKIYYIEVKKDMDDFLYLLRNQYDYNPYIFEIANKRYFPIKYAETEPKNVKKLLIFINILGSIPITDYQLFHDISIDINHPIYGTNYGYAIYPSSMMYGFASYMYFSSSEDSLYETTNITSSLSNDANGNFVLPDDVLQGHFSQSLAGGVNFSVLNDVDIGEIPSSLDEIVISSNMSKKLYGDDSIGKSLFVAYLSSQSRDENGEIHYHFTFTELKIVGVKEYEKNMIYHKESWSINFFQIILGVSAFNLGVTSIMVDCSNQKTIDKTISALKKAFPDYSISKPMDDISKSVNQVCSYIEIALMCFSIIAVIISTLLLSICNYLYILENKKDIGLVRCLGVNKNEAKKFVITHSVVMCFISFILSSIELFLTSILINQEMASQMGTSFSFSFNVLSLVYMFILAFVISLTSSSIISYRLNKLDPISAIKK